ncbi:MAG: hypothetical protein KKA67_12995 [Spirochaetes bacterium]|nr:hypothetical protein [Spirochaetota bacterium]
MDTAVPGITVAEIEEGGAPRTLVNGDYVRGSITLRGTVSDDLGIESVSLVFKDGSTDVTIAAAVDSSAQTWEAPIDTTAYLDGGKDFTVTVTDTAAKNSTSRFVLYFDNKPPTVLLTVPTASEGTVSDSLYGVIDIKGSAADQFGIRKVIVYVYGPSGALLYSSPDDASIGTNSFALRLDSSALLGKNSRELGYVYVRAWDRSGNTNVQFYRLDEIRALNSNQGATVEELHALETGSAASANGISLSQAVSARRYQPGIGYDGASLASYYFDQSANLPIVTISNPEGGRTAEQNILSRTAKASGIVEDANGVADVKAQFRLIDGSETVWFSDAAVGAAGGDIDVSGEGRVVNWTTRTLVESASYGLSVGVQAMRVQATDSLGNTRISDWVPFTIDADAPVVEITSPAPGTYVKGDPISITGTADSYGTATVASVALTVAGKFDFSPATLAGGGTQHATWSFGLTAANLPSDGLYTIKARITDSLGKVAYNNIVVTVDRTAPGQLAFISPSRGSSVNGYPTLMGQAKDNVLLKEVYLVFELSGEEVLLADTYNWSYQLDAGALANPAYGYDMGNNIYRVPIRIKAVDQAGNIAWSSSFGADKDNPETGSYYLDVDLDGDKPTITNILSPGGENEPDAPHRIIGSVKVQGVAFDDDKLYRVEMALIALAGATESWRSLDGASEVPAGTYHSIGSSALWSYVLNESGALYALAGVPGHAGDFKIMVRAVDTKDNGLTPDITGDPKTIYARFDNTLPGVLSLSPEEGTVHSGTIPLSFTAQDNNSVILAQISYNNGASYTTLPITPGQSLPLSVSIDTKTVSDNAFATATGTLYMRIRLKDDAANITEKSFKYLIDNIPPTEVDAPTVTSIRNDIQLDGETYLAGILGKVNDTGTGGGIEKVEVYFERLGSIYRMKPGAAPDSVVGQNYAFSYGGTALYPYATEPDDYDDYKIIIDKPETYVDSDGDGYPENFTQDTTGYAWGARFDSSKIPDGDVNVHYVAWDEAGNSSHFQVAGVVKNNPPAIETITIGTNLNGDSDATDDGERVRLIRQADGSWRGYTLDSAGAQLGAERAYDLSSPALTVRNSRLTVDTTVTGGTLPIQYSATAPDGSSSLLAWSATSAFEELSFSGSGWTEGVVNTITLRARDDASGTPLQATPVAIRVILRNSDLIPPTVSLERLGYDDYATSGPDALGHIEPWNQSPYGNVDAGFDKSSEIYGNDADVSGTIIVSGVAGDNQRIKELWAWIDLDGDAVVDASEERLVASFSGTSLQSVANPLGDLAITSQSLGQDGHEASFAFTWDSSSVLDSARGDVAIRFRATDFGPYGSVQSPSTLADASPIAAGFNAFKVDVVPYITGIATELSGAFASAPSAFARSSSGVYPVREGETVEVSGYNLDPATLSGEIQASVAASALQATKKYRVESVGSTNFVALGAASNAVGIVFTKNATAGTGTGTATPYMDATDASGIMEFSPHSGSGPFFVTVNGVPSVNNLKTTKHAWNLEPNGYNNDRLDDSRAFAVWDDTVVRSDSTVRYPVMAISPASGEEVGWAFDQSENNFYMTRKGFAPERFQSNPTRYYHTAFAFDERGFTYGAAQSGDISAGGGTISGWSSATFLAHRPGTQANTYMGAYQDGTNQNRILQLTSDGTSGNTDSERFRYPSIVATLPDAGADPSDGANKTVVYLAYYDSILNALRLRVGGAGADDTDVLIDGDLSDRYPAQPTNYSYVAGRTETSGAVTIADGATAKRSGQYSAIALSGSTLVIAWYDQSNRKLWFSYNTDPTNDAEAAQWQAHAITVDSDSSGWFVDLAVDAGGGIHMAYFGSSNGDLRYAYLENYLDTSAAAVTVDSFLAVGENVGIDVKWDSAVSKYVPYISYQMTTFLSTPYSIKLATRVDFSTANPKAGVASDKYTGAWEVMSVPTIYAAKDFKVSIGFKSFNGKAKQPVLGYATEETLEYTQLR